MGTDDNIKSIQAMYQAFGVGDVGSILNAVTDDVDWASDTSSTAASWFGVRHGKDGVASFFEAYGSAMEVAECTLLPSPVTKTPYSPWCTVEPSPAAPERRWT